MNSLLKSIIFNRDFNDSIKTSLSSATFVCIFSAFIKMDALRWVANNIGEDTNVKVIARWQLNDLIAGASDISAYNFAKENNWDFAINTNMHFKIYLIDENKLYVGSANLTNSGFHLTGTGNDEAGVQVVPSSIDIIQLRRYADSCCTITDDLYTELLEYYNQSDKQQINSKKDWPSNLKNKIITTFDHLWVNDLFFNSPLSIESSEDKYLSHDCALLNLKEINLEQRDDLLNRLKSTLLWDWVYRVVGDSENEYVGFGEITAKLHNSLLDNPKPYRKSVKNFVSNIFEWVRYLNPKEIGIKKFNHTESLFLIK